MTMTKNKTGIIQSRRLMMNTASVVPRPRGIHAKKGRAPLRKGAPPTTDNFLAYAAMYMVVAVATSPIQSSSIALLW